MSTLVASQVKFYSDQDEDVFFGWLKSISCVQDIRGVGDNIEIEVDDKKVDSPALRELIAICTRYEIEMSQLALLETDQNRAWFAGNPKAFWFEKVFGGQTGKRRLG